MYEKNSLTGKNILVTGGGSGLGLAMATRFLELGASVSICGRSKERLSEARDTLGSAASALTLHECDVRDYKAVGDMLADIVREQGALHALVNNAAGNFFSTSEDLTPNGFKTVVDIVLHGTFNCTQQFGRYLISEQIPGSILNIVTTYTESGSAFVLPSACAKAGVYALTTSLAYEWATYNIRVNAIAPGPFPTKGAWDRLMPDGGVEEAYRKKLPMKRFGDPEELSNLAVFLLSDLAPYISGECVTIDGAERLRSGSFNFLSEILPREELRKVFSSMRNREKNS